VVTGQGTGTAPHAVHVYPSSMEHQALALPPMDGREAPLAQGVQGLRLTWLESASTVVPLSCGIAEFCRLGRQWRLGPTDGPGTGREV
jgi:hypothetical protein